MKLLVESIIVNGDVDLLCGGVFILAKGTKVSCIKNSFIIVMRDSSKVGVMRDSSKVESHNSVIPFPK